MPSTAEVPKTPRRWCDTLVREHGWTRDEYAHWIERVAGVELLGPPNAEGATTQRERT
jgi:hypothetical protein